jgi:hypothetical protein
MGHTLSLRLATLAAGIAHAADTGARLSPADATRLHEDLQACAALAREMERSPAQAGQAGPDRFITIDEAERAFWARARA